MDQKSTRESPNSSKKCPTSQSESVPNPCGNERPSNGVDGTTSVNGINSNGQLGGGGGGGKSSTARSTETSTNSNQESSSSTNNEATDPGPSAGSNIANGNDSSRRAKVSTDPDNWLDHDPTPYHNSYPAPKWFSVKQLSQREYGRSLVSYL